MSDVRVFARDADGHETEITEGVAALYDLVISSMDWGSGFLTVEDALPVVHVAQTCHFEDYERAEKYVRNQQHSEAQAHFRDQHELEFLRWPVRHDHVYSPAGKCMWPFCAATGPVEPLPAPGSLPIIGDVDAPESTERL